MNLRTPAPLLTLLAALAIGVSCSGQPVPGSPNLTDRQRSGIADTVRKLLIAATDLTHSSEAAVDDPAGRMLALYPTTGRVISASGGELIVGRDSLAAAVNWFWENVGSNMVRPTWRWGEMYVDVLAADAAVVTAAYRIPHLTPTGHAHVIGGAWTAVFANRDGRWVVVQEHLSDAPPGMTLTPDGR